MNYTGFLNIYKEKGMTSMSVCARIRRILHVEKVGHAGTLDPMAEGVLPVALGRACKSVEDAGQGMKEYVAGMLLGTVTDTQDVTGTVQYKWDGTLPDEDKIRKTVAEFIGGYDQLTPMYSARQQGGRRLYDIARNGETVEREKKHIEISSIKINQIDLPHVIFTVTCSKGTYVRTICNDIGERLGCGACMESLVRTRVGNFNIADTLGFKDLEELEKKGVVDSALRIITPTAVAIGKFDGTHIGHQALLRELRKTCESQRLRSLILITVPEGKTIDGVEERRNRLLSMGIDYVITLPLTEEIRHMSPEDFLKDLLIKRYSMKYLVGGKDICFGYMRRGNAEFLKEHAAEYGFHFKLIDKVFLKETFGAANTGENTEISSTLLKEVLREGKMEEVRKLMGKNFELSGTVIHGRQLASSTMKLPTINMNVSEERELPPYGVYVSKVTMLGKEDRKYKNDLTAPKRKDFPTYYGISNFGHKPSVNNGQDPLSLETHILEETAEKDLYGKEISVELISFLRPEKSFATIAELGKQVREEDIPRAEKLIRSLKEKQKKTCKTEEQNI